MKIKYIILLISIALALSETDFKFLDKVESTIEINKDALLETTNNLLGSVEVGLKGLITHQCMNQLSDMKKLLAKVMERSEGTDEILYYSAVELVQQFPGLKKNCNIPMPEISTEMWTFEKFKSSKYCGVLLVSFSVYTATCLETKQISYCNKVKNKAKSVADCINSFYKNDLSMLLRYLD